MKIQRRYLVILLFVCFNFSIMAEQRSYQLQKKEGAIEIREYPEVMAAEVSVKGSRKAAASLAFRSLFNYISGENEQEQKIAMTAPVSQKEVTGNSWKVQFFMPQKLTKKTTPQPQNKNIIIRELKSTRMATITFSGRVTQDRLLKEEQALREFLKQEQIVFIDEAIYAFYDPPFKPWFLRRNEVCFVLDSEREERVKEK